MVPAAIMMKEIRIILPVPTLSVIYPPPMLPKSESHLFDAAIAAAMVTVIPMISVI